MTLERRRVCIIIAGILCLPTYIRAGMTTYEGTERYFWEEHAVVIAEISAKKPVDRHDRLTLNVLAVAATDRFVPTKLEVEVNNQGVPPIAYSGSFKLAVGETYIVCLVLRPDGKWDIESNLLSFFQSNTALDPIRDLEDPALRRFLVRLREVRRKASLNAAKEAIKREAEG